MDTPLSHHTEMHSKCWNLVLYLAAGTVKVALCACVCVWIGQLGTGVGQAAATVPGLKFFLTVCVRHLLHVPVKTSKGKKGKQTQETVQRIWLYRHDSPCSWLDFEICKTQPRLYERPTVAVFMNCDICLSRFCLLSAASCLCDLPLLCVHLTLIEDCSRKKPHLLAFYTACLIYRTL